VDAPFRGEIGSSKGSRGPDQQQQRTHHAAPAGRQLLARHRRCGRSDDNSNMWSVVRQLTAGTVSPDFNGRPIIPFARRSVRH